LENRTHRARDGTGGLGFYCLVWLLALYSFSFCVPIPAQARARARAQASAPHPLKQDESCLACHGQPGMTSEKGKSIPIDPAKHAASVHGTLSCKDCHSTIKDYPHPVKVVKVECSTCHDDEASHVPESVHSALGEAACESCHGNHHEVATAAQLTPEKCAQCHADEVKEFKQSIHGKAAASGDPDAPNCISCHGPVHQIQTANDAASLVAKKNLPETCASCHSNQQFLSRHNIPFAHPVELYRQSVHGRAVAAGDGEAASCSDCHGSHGILPSQDVRSKINHFNIPATCGQCHTDIAKTYLASVHGQAMKNGVSGAPVCVDCHGEHLILAPKEQGSLVNASRVSMATCGRCHSDERLALRYNLPTDRVPSFADSYHGLAMRGGSQSVANCGSCHGVHNIFPSKDARSTVNAANLAKTCGNCHAGAGDHFVIGPVHVRISTGPAHPVVKWIRWTYLALIPLTLGFMIVHNLLDFVAKLMWRQARHVSGAKVSRMNLNFRIAHAGVLGRQPRPKGPRLTILTNAGGPAVLATDSLVANGGELAELSSESLRRLDDFLPAHWSHNNPIDVLGDADSERYARALEIASQDPNSDGLLVILAPQGMTDPLHIAERLKPYAKELGKPVLASWMGGNSIAAGEAALNSAGIPTFSFPDTAARAFTYMWQYTYNLRGLYQTPTLTEDSEMTGAARNRVEQIIQNARDHGRTLLTELESKQLLSLYGIPSVETRVAASPDEAAKLASEIGFPVVLKVFSETITHKTDVGGVKLNLQDEASVRTAYRAIQSSVTEKAGPDQFAGVTVQPMVKLDGYELILGSSVDPQFGPVILFGSGGQLVEVYRDRALALPPLNTTLARRMMEQTRVFTALKGVRGRKPVNLAALEQLLVRFSQLVLEQRQIAEIDINPLLVSPQRLLALDARIVLHGPAVTLDQLPKPAIRPYPLQYVSPWTMKDGNQVSIRPIRPEDEPLMVKFHETLSDRSVYLRYFCSLSLSRRVEHERLLRICFGGYDREMVMVAGRTDPSTGECRIVAVGRMNKLHSGNEAEVAILVSDQYQKLGLGSELLRRVIQIARDEKLTRVSAEMLTDNIAMQIITRRLGFRVHAVEDPTSVRSFLDL